MTNPTEAKVKEIKDYLHLYLGAEVVCTGKKAGIKHYKLVSVSTDGTAKFKTIPEGFDMQLTGEWKLILRPLSSMTEEEAIECAKLSEWEPHFRDPKVERTKYGDLVVTWDGAVEGGERQNVTGDLFWCPEQFQYLLSKHFDLFELIVYDLAIDKTTLPGGSL